MKNRISDDAAAHIAATFSPFLAALHPQSRYEAHIQLGLLRWRSDDVDALRHHMRAAAGDWLLLVEPLPDGVRPTSSPHAMSLPVLVTALFGDDAQRMRLARLPRTSGRRGSPCEVARATHQRLAFGTARAPARTARTATRTTCLAAPTPRSRP